MTKRQSMPLTPSDRAELERIANSRTEAAARVQRAKILLLYCDGNRIAGIVRTMQTNRPLIERVIDKAAAFGALHALKDLHRSGAPAKITDDAKSWVVSIACQKPTDMGYAHETWTYSLLIKHIRTHFQQAGYPCLEKIGKGRLNAILTQHGIKPHKIRYYLERRDPDFEGKMANVLCVYKEVEIQNASDNARDGTTISYDEKPGIQAIRNIAADLMPVPGKHAAISRDYEYKRLGTVSLLAGIDLHTGHITPMVSERHRSREFIEFLSKLNERYPKHWKIRLILDNHSCHISKETQKYLLGQPGRYEFIFTPKHGSWLNMIEMFFSKIARTFLRHIRVQSRDELVARIYLGIEQLNEEPVIFRWHYRMDEIEL